jgi:hypothetical protein
MQGPDRTGQRSASPVQYEGEAFAPPASAYVIADLRTVSLTTLADSGYAPEPITRVAELGLLGPLALAALWEAAFAYEAGPLSTWWN